MMLPGGIEVDQLQQVALESMNVQIRHKTL